MDLHDYENLNTVSNFLKKLLNYPKWIKHTRNLKKKRKFLYDSTLMLVDKYIGKILKVLDEDTLLFITSDHGHRKSLKNQIQRSYITNDYFNEMHGEDIEVPLISNINLGNDEKNNSKLYDTISISKKIISELNIEIHKYIKKDNDDKRYIISEHAGRGNFNLDKDLFFTISNNQFRMIVAFIENELFIKLYAIEKDPLEIHDISNDEKYKVQINDMFNFLKSCRQSIVHKKIEKLVKVNNRIIQF